MSASRPNKPEGWAEAAEARLLAEAIPLAGKLGWTEDLVMQAARAARITDADAELLLPHGPRDLAALLSRRHDAIALEALSGLQASHLKIR